MLHVAPQRLEKPSCRKAPGCAHLAARTPGPGFAKGAPAYGVSGEPAGPSLALLLVGAAAAAAPTEPRVPHPRVSQVKRGRGTAAPCPRPAQAGVAPRLGQAAEAAVPFQKKP